MGLFDVFIKDPVKMVIDTIDTEILGNDKNWSKWFMKTPTKEKIEKVLKETSKHTERPNFPFVILNLMDLGYDDEDITNFIITEWEKIRS